MLSDLDLPTTLQTPAYPVTLRRATEDDLPTLVAMVADDPISAGREGGLDGGSPETYRPALLEVLQNASNDLLVAVDASGALLATLQLTSDEARKDAHRFYEHLGFVGSHRGFTFHLGRTG